MDFSVIKPVQFMPRMNKCLFVNSRYKLYWLVVAKFTNFHICNIICKEYSCKWRLLKLHLHRSQSPVKNVVNQVYYTPYLLYL